MSRTSLRRAIPRALAIAAALTAAIAFVPSAALAAADDQGRGTGPTVKASEPTLVARATLSADHLEEGPASGALASAANGRQGPWAGRSSPVSRPRSTTATVRSGHNPTTGSVRRATRPASCSATTSCAPRGRPPRRRRLDRRRAVHLATTTAITCSTSGSSTTGHPIACSPVRTSTSSRSCARRTAPSGSARSSDRSCCTSTPRAPCSRSRSRSRRASRPQNPYLTSRRNATGARQPRVRGARRLDERALPLPDHRGFLRRRVRPAPPRDPRVRHEGRRLYRPHLELRADQEANVIGDAFTVKNECCCSSSATTSRATSR